METLSSRRITQLERAIEAALRPGRFIAYRASWDFVRGVEEVAGDVRALIGDGHADEAVTLFETFIAASYEKAGEVDDSSGGFGMLVGKLFCDWVQARQATEAKPEETVDLLHTWMEDDDTGFCYELERELVKVLNEEGLGAFATGVRERLAASAPDDNGPVGYPRRRWTAALKRILAAQGDAEAYVALAAETGIGSKDCNIVAGICEDRDELDEALNWVERGLAVAARERYTGAEHDLKKQQRALLLRLGRAGDAIAATWSDFERSPNKYGYETLMELVPAGERAAWHNKAMSAADRGDLSSIIGLFIETREVERLAACIDTATDGQLEEMSDYTTKPAAEMMAGGHPALAARVFRALGLCIVGAGQSKHYGAALGHFERARDCYTAAGQEAKWDGLVAEVRREHGRKSSFMPGFERLAEGGPAVDPRPRFLDRARSRWPRGDR